MTAGAASASTSLERVTLNSGLGVCDAPDRASLSNLLFETWQRIAAATPHCTHENPCTTPSPGDRIVIGRAGRDRAVYVVTAAGAGGYRLTREA